jgi:hypothetical protein
MVTFSRQITPGGQRLLIIYITQPFRKRLGQNNNLLGKGWAKTQPFPKRLDQKFTCNITSKFCINFVLILY